ncbi:hypothetical protein COCNU_14G005450 [Cocos nucifera]|uniref:Uncharacterized protein n=1 Tax=Cocos nucifera TaxID=13894 RepID=A0A8K0IUS5_COCNU|nr:hypothetical protein COCNU_14G005450 [Cocos nucifera]
MTNQPSHICGTIAHIIQSVKVPLSPMERSTPKILLSLSLIALLFSAFIISPSHSRKISGCSHPTTGGDVAGSSRGLARMAREAELAPPSPTANRRDPGSG